MNTRRYSGVPVPGLGRARKLGFPTINIVLPDPAIQGIFAAQVSVGAREYPAAAFADPSRGILEAHLIGFSGELPAGEIVIKLCARIRDSRPFEDDDALRSAIAEDIAAVRRHFTA